MFKNVYIVEKNSPLKVMLRSTFVKAGYQVMDIIDQIPDIAHLPDQVSWIIIHVTSENCDEIEEFLKNLFDEKIQVHVSFILTKEFRDIYPKLCSLGALSYFKSPILKNSITAELSDFSELCHKDMSALEISVHYVRKIFSEECMYDDWLLFERQMIESNVGKSFQDSLSNFSIIYEAKGDLRKSKEHNIIYNISMGIKVAEYFQKPLRILVMGQRTKVSEYFLRLNKNMFSIIQEDTKHGVYPAIESYDYICIDWDNKDKSWINYAAQYKNKLKIILINVPDKVGRIKDYGITISIRKSAKTEEIFELLVRDLLSYGLGKVYQEKKETFFEVALSGDLEKLKVVYRDCLSFCSSHKNPDTSLFEAEYLYIIEEYKLAKFKAEKYMMEVGENRWLIELLARIYIKLGHHEKAAPLLERAIFLSANDVAILCRIAESYAEIGDYDKNSRYLNDAIQLKSSSLQVIETKLKSKIIFGEIEDSESIITKLPSLNRIIAYLNNLAISYARSGDLRKSIDLYQDALEILSSHDADVENIISYNLALCHLRGRDAESALSILCGNQSVKVSEKRKSLMKNIKNFKNANRIDVLYEHFMIENKKISIETSDLPRSNNTISYNLRGYYHPVELTNVYVWHDNNVSGSKRRAS